MSKHELEEGEIAALRRDKARLDFKDGQRVEWAAQYGLRCQSWRDDIDREMAEADDDEDPASY